MSEYSAVDLIGTGTEPVERELGLQPARSDDQ